MHFFITLGSPWGSRGGSKMEPGGDLMLFRPLEETRSWLQPGLVFGLTKLQVTPQESSIFWTPVYHILGPFCGPFRGPFWGLRPAWAGYVWARHCRNILFVFAGVCFSYCFHFPGFVLVADMAACGPQLAPRGSKCSSRYCGSMLKDALDAVLLIFGSPDLPLCV